MPHVLLKRALEVGLTGAEWVVLLISVLFTVGHNKQTCTPGLMVISKRSNLTRPRASRARNALVEKGFLIPVKPCTFRRAAEFKLNLECNTGATVTPEQPSKAQEGLERGSEEPSSVTSEQPGCNTGATGELSKHYRGVTLEQPFIESIHRKPSIDSFQRASLKGFGETIVESAKSALPTSSFSKSLNAKSEKQKPKHPYSEKDLDSLLEFYLEIRGRSVSPNKTEKRTIRQKWEEWPTDSNFAMVFIQDLKNARFNGNVPRETDNLMQLIRDMSPDIQC